MLRSPTLDKLRDLNLLGMARALEGQMASAEHQARSFDDRLGLMVDTEQEDRENRRLFRYLKSARLRDNACVEDLDFRHPRGLDRGLVLALAEARWVDAHQSVLVVGATGLGKTFIACALAQAAIRRGHTALYLRFPRMIDELSIARVDGRLPRLLATWARLELLVVDDLGMQGLTNQQSADLLQVIEDRHQRRSTIHPQRASPRAAQGRLPERVADTRRGACAKRRWDQKPGRKGDCRHRSRQATRYKARRRPMRGRPDPQDLPTCR